CQRIEIGFYQADRQEGRYAVPRYRLDQRPCLGEMMPRVLLELCERSTQLWCRPAAEDRLRIDVVALQQILRQVELTAGGVPGQRAHQADQCIGDTGMTGDIGRPGIVALRQYDCRK